MPRGQNPTQGSERRYCGGGSIQGGVYEMWNHRAQSTPGEMSGGGAV